MKILAGLFLTLSIFVSVNQLQAQSKKEKKQQAKHLSEYETQSLSENQLPVLMPYNRWIDPAGEQIYFGDNELENHAMDCSASPDGKWIAVEGRYSVVILSAENNKTVDRATLKELLGESAMNTFSGISWRKSGDDYEIFWSASGNNKSFVIKALWNGKKLKLSQTYDFTAELNAKSALPNEIAISEENGIPVFYVVLNGNNKLVKINANTGENIWSVETGVAPFGVVKSAGKIYVTNWAGSIPDDNDKNVAGVPWGKAKVDPVTGATREGTVSVYNSTDGTLIKEILVGLHPNDIITSPGERFVFVANSNSDAISVIDTKSDFKTETIPVRLGAEKNPYFGDSPNGLGISGDGKTLYVAMGMDNAIAVVELGRKAAVSSTENESKISGFIPTGAYPGGVCVYNDSKLYIPNIEAKGARIPFVSEETGVTSFNSHRQMASISVIAIPDKSQLADYTKKVEETNQFFRVSLSQKMPRKNAKPVPVPARIGEPSVFKHVVYIIKENRTYDQILGDVKAGDGEPSLCIFGEEVTPNTHKIS